MVNGSMETEGMDFRSDLWKKNHKEILGVIAVEIPGEILYSISRRVPNEIPGEFPKKPLEKVAEEFLQKFPMSYYRKNP